MASFLTSQISVHECGICQWRSQFPEAAVWRHPHAPPLEGLFVSESGQQRNPLRRGCSQGCIRTADNHRRRGVTPPPPLDPDFTVGNNEIYQRKYFWAIFGTQTFGSQTPPPSLFLYIPPGCSTEGGDTPGRRPHLSWSTTTAARSGWVHLLREPSEKAKRCRESLRSVQSALCFASQTTHVFVTCCTM